jgi:hypothetical protein
VREEAGLLQRVSCLECVHCFPLFSFDVMMVCLFTRPFFLVWYVIVDLGLRLPLRHEMLKRALFLCVVQSTLVHQKFVVFADHG